jgi:exosortase A-associated hydrolase 1
VSGVPREEPVVFACGGEQLLGIVHHAPGAAGTVGVVVIVGGPQYRVGSHRQFTLLARSLAAAGFAVLRFDHRGIGDSDGQVRSFEDIAEDIRAAVGALARAVPSLQRVVLWGLCDAASAALLSVPGHPLVSGLVLANPWVRTASGEAQTYLRHYYGGRLLQRAFWKKLAAGGVNPLRTTRELLRTVFTARRRLADGSAPHYVERMRAGLAAFQGPVLLLLSERDLTAREFSGLCAASAAWTELTARRNVRVQALAGADHTFSQRASLELATRYSRELLDTVAGLTPP